MSDPEADHAPRAPAARSVSHVPGARARGPRRLAAPRRAAVTAGEGGRPDVVDGHEVAAVRETWLVEDRWWTEAPLRRRYWEVVTANGRCLVVFHDLQHGGWHAHR